MSSYISMELKGWKWDEELSKFSNGSELVGWASGMGLSNVQTSMPHHGPLTDLSVHNFYVWLQKMLQYEA